MLVLSGCSNRAIILDSRQEGSHEKQDRVLRRWRGFCTRAGFDPDLTQYTPEQRELVTRTFLTCYRTATWDEDGRPSGHRRQAVAVSTIREAAGHLATTFRNRFLPSPVHQPDRPILLPSIRALLKAFDNVDPPPNRQKAVTPRLLRGMHARAAKFGRDSLEAVVSDLAILAFFFAMRSCEFVSVPIPGRTKLLSVRSLQFWDSNHRPLPYNSTKLASQATRISVTFTHQKNAIKNDTRTQERTGDPILCPLRAATSIISRLRRSFERVTPSTPLNMAMVSGVRTQATQQLLAQQLRQTCADLGGASKLGYSPSDIGTKSIRSGAAMALFLHNHPVSRIMILGRWSSDAFLAYIRPQVLEWTNNMSRDMIALDNFFHISNPPPTNRTDQDTQRAPYSSFTGPSNLLVPKLHLFH